MKRRMVLIIALCGMALLIPAISWAHGRAPVPLGEGGELPDGDAPSPTPHVQLGGATTVLQDGDVHQYPTTDAPLLGTVRSGDVVRVNEYVGEWARIAVEERALGGPVIPLADGWIAGTLLDAGTTPTPGTTPAPDATLGTTPAPDATPNPSWPTYGRTPTAGPVPSNGPALDAPFPAQPATQPTTPSGTAPGVPAPTVRVSVLPAARGLGAPAQALLPISFSIPTCYDRNANQFCDIDGEGIAGLSVYATDAGGQLLGRALTDASGVAQFTIRAPATAQISVSVPYLGSNQSFPASNPRPVPVRLPASALLPALLPLP